MTPPVMRHRVDGPEDAPVLVLQSSIGTTTEMWRPQIEALAASWRVVRTDWPGHGGSPDPDAPIRMGDLADGILAVLDELGVERASYCGLSLGGMAGMWLASHAPERVERLVLCCTSALMGHEVAEQRVRTVRSEGMGSVVDGIVGRWFTTSFADERPDVIAEYRAMVEAVSPVGYTACYEAIGEWDGRELLDRIRAPTLVIAGAQDPATPVEHAELIHRGIAGSRLRVFDPAAHLASVEEAEGVTRAIAGHLEGES